MGSTLTIEPAYRKKKTLCYEIKRVLQKKVKGCIHDLIMDESDIPYLQALKDMEVPDVEIILEYIDKYGSVVLNEEF